MLTRNSVQPKLLAELGVAYRREPLPDSGTPRRQIERSIAARSARPVY